MNSLLKKPSAWLPIAFSFAILLMELWAVMTYGVASAQRDKDEGVLAHLFQIWLVLEIPMILYFATRWLQENPRKAFLILIIQIFAVLAGMFPVFYFKF